MALKNRIFNMMLVGATALAMLSSCAGDDAMGEGYLSNRDKLYNPKSLELAGNEHEVSFELTANGKWEASGMPDWLTLSPSNGVGNATVKVSTTGDNPSSASSRVAELTIKSDNKENSLTITQKASAFAMKVDVDTLTFTKDDNGAQQSFVVDCNCPWQLDYDKENKKFSISVESSVIKVSTTGNNTTEQTNSLDLQIIPDETVPNAKSQTVHVVQKGIETKFYLTRDTIKVKAIGEEVKFNLNGDATWSAEVYSDIDGWVDFGPVKEGVGSHEITVTCQTTNQQSARSARLVFWKTYDISVRQTVAIIQEGSNPPEIPAENLSVVPHKYSATVTVTPVSALPVNSCSVSYYPKKNGPSNAVTLQCTKGTDGVFTVEIHDLTSMTDYMVRASAVNNVGTINTDYQQFTTSGGVPNEDDTPIPGL